MAETHSHPAPQAAGADHAPTAAPQPDLLPPVETEDQPADQLVEDDLLVEEISIDGMCGVY